MKVLALILLSSFAFARNEVVRPSVPTPSTPVERVKAQRANCKAGRGFRAKGCKAVQLGHGDVLGQNCRGGHKGCDYARRDKGAGKPPIFAVQGGTVDFAGWSNDYGNRVVIDHGGGHFTIYSHLSALSVRKGSKVSGGQVLGIMGSTGKSTGVHLHFETVRGGRFVNPGSVYAQFCN